MPILTSTVPALPSPGSQRISNNNAAKNIFRSLYIHFEEKDITKKLMDEHGWSVRVEHDYFVAVDSSEIRFVWLRRFNPQRWFSVYWEPVDDPSLLSKEWMLQKRADVIEKFYAQVSRAEYLFCSPW